MPRECMSQPRTLRGWLFAIRVATLLAVTGASVALAEPHVPTDDNAVLAELSAGTRYADVSARRLARSRVDVAIPLAQFYIQQSRLSGDLRYLGYAEAVLAPWVKQTPPQADVLVLQAALQQSRHEFAASLATLDRALSVRPEDAQALLIRATVLRVLGRYPEASTACERFSRLVETRLAALCIQGLRGLSGQLQSAYSSLAQVSTQGWLNSEKSWLYSELGEMAVRLGREQEAERWFGQDLRLSPSDFYVRAAYADLMLQQGRPREALALLHGQESLEPLLLRIAIAQKQLRDPALGESSERLRAAFTAELQRGEAVHRREQARFLLEIEDQPHLSLAAALENWTVQHEPDDVLVLVRAAMAAGNPRAAAPAVDFARAQGQNDVRIDALTPAISASR
jgi:tetratricopeptide (TPR) repeat protein